MYQPFSPSTESLPAQLPPSGSIQWTSPSNIALIKYWGKKGVQLPMNASLSVTLRESVSHVTLDFQQTEKGLGGADFYFEGQEHPVFNKLVMSYLEHIRPWFPFLNRLWLKIDSRNSFPHSAGIASSASFMSALALCICQLENYPLKEYGSDFLRKASFMARLGSGSAARSVYGKMAAWGKHPAIHDSSDQYAIPFPEKIPAIFQNLQDTIVVVDAGTKKVSSSQGHQLMKNHPYAQTRLKQANQNFHKILEAAENSNWKTFASIIENEALSLHAMMLSSIPGFSLLKQQTLEIIEKVKNFRDKHNAMITFTLDAGPNVHLLYPHQERKMVLPFIHDQIKPLAENERIIADQMGNGPQPGNKK